MYKRRVFLFIIVFLVSGVVYGGSITWREEDVKYFQNKEYVPGYIGGKAKYIYNYGSIDFYPPYLREELQKAKTSRVSTGNLKDCNNGKLNKETMEDLLRSFVLLRNEIYARHGYIFKDKALKEFFGQMPWYKPEKEKIDFQTEFSLNERVGIIHLKYYEKAAEEGIKWAEKQALLTKEVIVNAPWGNGKGEFALEPLPESYEYITFFTIGPNGSFYILDPNNQRVNVFSKEGRFLRDIPIPSLFIHKYGNEKRCLVEGIGVDRNGNIYLARSSMRKDWGFDEIVIKADSIGNVIKQYKFIDASIMPQFIEDESGEILLWGKWSEFIYALIPLETAEKGSVKVTYSFLDSKDLKSSVLPDKKAFGNEYPTAFVKKGKRIAGYVPGYGKAGNVVFIGADGKVKEKIPIYYRYYPRGHGLPYKGHEVIVSVCPWFDKDFNIYFIDGTEDGLHVIKYTPSKEIWK